MIALLRLALLTVACLWAAGASAQVYRCGNSYSHEPCKGARVVDTSPLIESAGPQSPKPVTLYLCQSQGGGRFWSQRHCQQHGAWIDRTETVPGHLAWEHQVATAEAQRNAAQSLTAPPERSYNSSQAAQPSRRGECEALDQQVKELDRMGRAGSRYYDLDRIRDERREARDQQFRLRC
ncbi:hypothetical protein [Paracidovorax konjaci]|nr:hypothetical protein [Paracidovorax konjaci]